MTHEIHSWLQEKLSHKPGGVRVERSITHEWVRHMGGRSMRAGLALSVSPADQFSIVVVASSAEPSYVHGVKNGVISVLMSESYSPILLVKVVVSDLQIHEMDSSYAAFFMVASEATREVIKGNLK